MIFFILLLFSNTSLAKKFDYYERAKAMSGNAWLEEDDKMFLASLGSEILKNPTVVMKIYKSNTYFIVSRNLSYGDMLNFSVDLNHFGTFPLVETDCGIIKKEYICLFSPDPFNENKEHFEFARLKKQTNRIILSDTYGQTYIFKMDAEYSPKL